MVDWNMILDNNIPSYTYRPVEQATVGPFDDIWNPLSPYVQIQHHNKVMAQNPPEHGLQVSICLEETHTGHGHSTQECKGKCCKTDSAWSSL